MKETSDEKLRGGWWRHPLFACGVVAAGLVSVGDAYPLSPFPMYSNIDVSADMLLVTNEKDEVLPLSRLFNNGSAQLKKRFETLLKSRAGSKQYEEVTKEQREAVGVEFLQNLWKVRDKGDVANLPTVPQRVRLKIRTVSMVGTEFEDEIIQIAELDVSGEGGAP